jgi:hypothetical protein
MPTIIGPLKVMVTDAIVVTLCEPPAGVTVRSSVGAEVGAVVSPPLLLPPQPAISGIPTTARSAARQNGQRRVSYCPLLIEEAPNEVPTSIYIAALRAE